VSHAVVRFATSPPAKNAVTSSFASFVFFAFSPFSSSFRRLSTLNVFFGVPGPASSVAAAAAFLQGLTLVNFSAQLEPYLTHINTLHTLHNPLTRASRPLRAPPIPCKALKLS
jgi:hypothetical protein